MTYKRSRANSDRNWLFFHPTVGDNWTHLVEREYCESIENYCEVEEKIAKKTPKKTNLSEKLVLLAVSIGLLIGGTIWLLEITELRQVNVNLTEKRE